MEASESEGREIRGLEGLLITPGRYAECARCTARLVGSGLPEGFLTGMNQTRVFSWTPHHLPAEGSASWHVVPRNLL